MYALQTPSKYIHVPHDQPIHQETITIIDLTGAECRIADELICRFFSNFQISLSDFPTTSSG